jgi:hypothetical protein
MTVSLNKGHYTLVNDKNNLFIKAISFTNQTLTLYFCDGETTTCYDGKDIIYKSSEELQDDKSKIFEDYALVKTESRMRDNITKEMRKKTTDDLILEYNDYIGKVEALKIATNGSIDMRRYRYSESSCHLPTLID